MVLFESIQEKAVEVKSDFQGGDKKKLEEVSDLSICIQNQSHQI